MESTCPGTGISDTVLRGGYGQYLELIMASSCRGLWTWRTPLGRRVPALSAGGKERGVVAAPILFKLLFLLIRRTTTGAGSLWAEIVTTMPSAAARNLTRETTVDQATQPANGNLMAA